CSAVSSTNGPAPRGGTGTPIGGCWAWAVKSAAVSIGIPNQAGYRRKAGSSLSIIQYPFLTGQSSVYSIRKRPAVSRILRYAKHRGMAVAGRFLQAVGRTANRPGRSPENWYDVRGRTSWTRNRNPSIPLERELAAARWLRF